MNDARTRAWETRRRKYGPHGHAGCYSRSSTSCVRCVGMRDLIIRLHNEGVLSEGQAAKATGLHRIDLRAIADELRP